MATRQRKADKRRLKRQKAKREQQATGLRLRRRMANDAHPIHASLGNRHWSEDGMASILFARDIAPGRVTLAAFLIDVWAMGLKDAWGRVDIGVSEFNELVTRQGELLELRPLNVGTARHLVYGGIQLAQELGFRLPRRYERWTAILGPLPDGEPPDMSLFLVEGKIRLTCPRRDFEARLIGTSPQEFLARPDVEFCLGDEGFTLVDEDQDELFDTVTALEEALLERVQQWCFASGQAPHPLLPDAVGAVIESSFQAVGEDLDAGREPGAPYQGEEERMAQLASASLVASGHQDPGGMEAALSQVQGFMRSLDSPEDLFESLGLEADDGSSLDLLS